MIPWIQVYSNLPQHPKTSRLADELGLTSAAFNPNTLAVGLLVCLWTWAIQNATGGDLSSCSPRAIAEACQWKKKPEILIKALIKSGYMDADMKLHDWDDYTAMYQDLQDDTKEKHRDRQKRYRERQKKASVTVTRDACVTSHGDACDAIPYLTRPNLTLPDQKEPVKYIADFVYNDGCRRVVEDVKGYTDPKSAAYKLYTVKRKLMLRVHGITIKEV